MSEFCLASELLVLVIELLRRMRGRKMSVTRSIGALDLVKVLRARM